MTYEAVRSALSDYEIIYKTASDLIRKADEAHNEPARREFFLGQAAYEMREYDLAVGHLHESERLAATAEIAARLALCCWRQLELDEAAKWIGVALERDPKGTIKAYCIGTTSSFEAIRASIEFGRGNIANALDFANRAISQSNGDALAHVTRASALLCNGEHQESSRALDAAAAHAPAYLRRQIDALRSVVHDLADSGARGHPLLAELTGLTAAKAI